MKLTTLKLVYRNMIVDRPKFGLLGLIFFATFCCSNLYFGSLKFGQPTAIFMGVLGLIMWFVAMPMIFTMIDIKNNPKRMEKIWKTIQK